MESTFQCHESPLAVTSWTSGMKSGKWVGSRQRS